MLIVSVFGYLWLFHSINHSDRQGLWQGCPTKQFLHIPCPSCGTTRSIMLIIKGDLFSALYTNPLGFLAATLLVIVPVWICIDLIRNSSSLLKTYNRLILLINKPRIYIPCIILLIANWIWNITKFT